MVGETELIAGDRAALGWAIGCFAGALRTRIASTGPASLRPSRPVLALEMITCFTWLTCLFASAVLGLLARRLPMPPLGGALVASLLGPVALGAAAALVYGRTGTIGRATLVTLALLAALTLTMLGGARLYPLGWREQVLCVLLPLAGTAHLVALGREGSPAEEA